MAVNRLNVGATNQLLAKASTGQSTNILELQNTAGVTVAGVDASGNPVGGLAHPANFKNLVINGDMQIAQRGTSTASITSVGYFTADRWFTEVGTLGTWTQSVENDAPTGSGFRKSLKMLCTTADASPAAGDYLTVQTRFEGQNLQHIKKGTAAAEQLTVSFWVKANVTGTYTIFLYDNDNTRMINASYTINASATWEYKTITLAPDTTGVFDNDNAYSLALYFNLSAGSNRTSGTISNTWAAYSTANEAPGQVNLASATSNYWQVTGVQLEVGNTATEFEFLPAHLELMACQRYYEKSYDIETKPGTASADSGVPQHYGSTDGSGNIVMTNSFKVTKRAIPTTTFYTISGTSGQMSYYRNGANGNVTANAYRVGQGIVGRYCATGSGFVVAFAEGHFVADAEL
jgi:hypothetical protein